MVSNTGGRGAPKGGGGISMALRLTSKGGGKGEQMKEGTKEELCQKLTLVST